jgi:hypothetical protein
VQPSGGSGKPLCFYGKFLIVNQMEVILKIVEKEYEPTLYIIMKKAPKNLKIEYSYSLYLFQGWFSSPKKRAICC